MRGHDRAADRKPEAESLVAKGNEWLEHVIEPVFSNARAAIRHFDREMFERVRPYVQGLQVSAPFGKVAFALQVFDGVPGIRTDLTEEAVEDGDTFGFAPPATRQPMSVPLSAS